MGYRDGGHRHPDDRAVIRSRAPAPPKARQAPGSPRTAGGIGGGYTNMGATFCESRPPSLGAPKAESAGSKTAGGKTAGGGRLAGGWRAAGGGLGC
jgi:hypothetical protein